MELEKRLNENKSESVLNFKQNFDKKYSSGIFSEATLIYQEQNGALDYGLQLCSITMFESQVDKNNKYNNEVK
jgi:hypothetical protein